MASTSNSLAEKGSDLSEGLTEKSVPTIEVKELEMAYGSYVVMRNVNFTVSAGEVMVIMGGSGCGKSTLLKYMIGLKEVEKGEILYHGKSFPKASLEEREAMQKELHSELCASHPLFGLSVVALARRYDQDDVLFELADSRVAEVHLTWSRKPEHDPRWPRTIIFASATIWAEEQMRCNFR